MREIIEIGTRAPLRPNTQPWKIAVVAENALDSINNGNVEKLVSGEPSKWEIPSKPYEGRYRQCQIEFTIKIFEVMNIARTGKEKRAKWQQKGYRLFDPPAACRWISRSMNCQRSLSLDLAPAFDTRA